MRGHEPIEARGVVCRDSKPASDKIDLQTSGDLWYMVGMPLRGDAKRVYQREYMRRRRGKPEASNVKPKAGEGSTVLLDPLEKGNVRPVFSEPMPVDPFSGRGGATRMLEYMQYINARGYTLKTYEDAYEPVVRHLHRWREGTLFNERTGLTATGHHCEVCGFGGVPRPIGRSRGGQEP